MFPSPLLGYSHTLYMLELMDSIDKIEELSEELYDDIMENPTSVKKFRSEFDLKKHPAFNRYDQEINLQDRQAVEQFRTELNLIENGLEVPSSSCGEETEERKRKVNVDNPYRGLKNTSSPLEDMTDTDILKEYKLSRKSICEVVELLKNDLKFRFNNRGQPLSPLMMVLCTLKYLTSGASQSQTMDGVSQGTTSRTITRVTHGLAAHYDKYIKFPTAEEVERVKYDFYRLAKFPEVIGCLGATQIGIRVKNAKEDKNVSYRFRNEHGFHSLKVQLVIGPNGEIYDIDPTHPGSLHENSVYTESDLRRRQMTQTLNGVFIAGDSYNPAIGVMTNVKNPQMMGEYYYNDALTKTYPVYWNAVDSFKRRFKCLQTFLYCGEETQQNVLYSCAIIHNIARNNNDIMSLEDQQSEIDVPAGRKIYINRRIEVPLVDDNALLEREKFIGTHFPTYYENEQVSSSHVYF